jgi:hypothetical protein
MDDTQGPWIGNTECEKELVAWKSETVWISACGTPSLSQICKGLLPMLYKIDRKPDWNVLRNILHTKKPVGIKMKICFE